MAEITLTRICNAPRQKVWDAFTQPDQMMRWWGPAHFTAPVCKIDLRVGGKYLSCMQSPDGQKFWSTGTYKEILPLEKLVCTDSFADENGAIVPASHYGMEGDFPLELDVTFTFEDADEGKTKLTLKHVGIPEGQIKEMTMESWGTSLDKLEESLKA